jgi:hypothetical protein
MHREYLVFTDPALALARPDYYQFLPDPRAAEPFRVQQIGSAQDTNQPVLFGYECVEGYHGVMIARHRQLKEAMGKRYLEYLNLMNARYLFSPQAYQIPGLVEKGFASGTHVYENLMAQGRAFLAYKTRNAGNQDEASAVMQDKSFDPAREAVWIGGPVLNAGVKPGTGRVAWVRRTALDFDLEVETPAEACLVVSQNWYPGWRAEVDGKPERIYETDLALQGLRLLPGRHTVKFAFSSPRFSLGLVLSGLAWVFMAGFGVYFLAGRFKPKNS